MAKQRKRSKLTKMMKVVEAGNRWVGENLFLDSHMTSPAWQRGKDNEDELIENIDDKALLVEMLKEHVQIEKLVHGMKDADEVLSLYQVPAAKALVRSMLFGGMGESRKAATELLNRVKGKPVDRQISVNASVNAMPMEEVDYEIMRLREKLKDAL